MKNFRLRTITGILLVTIIFFATLLSIYSYFVIFLFIVVLGVWEIYSLSAKHGKVNPLQILGIILAATLFTASFVFEITDSPILYWAVHIEIIACFIIELYRNKSEAMNNLAHTFFAVIYFALPLSFFNLMLFKNGLKTDIILIILLLVWVFDTSAYVVGSFFGEHKLFERISPNKSWEGVLGGGILTLVFSYFLPNIFRVVDFPHIAVLAFFVIILGTFGDLTASLIKRSANVKDSGIFIPGHGGILDRFDTMLLSVPAIFIYLKIVEII